MEPLGIFITDAAKALGVTRKTLSAVVNGRSGISPEMAIRLGKAFDTTPESWLNQQVMYDLNEVLRTTGNMKLRKLVAV